MNRPVHGPQNPTVPVDDATDTYDTIDWPRWKNVPESNGKGGNDRAFPTTASSH